MIKPHAGLRRPRRSFGLECPVFVLNIAGAGVGKVTSQLQKHGSAKWTISVALSLFTLFELAEWRAEREVWTSWASEVGSTDGHPDYPNGVVWWTFFKNITLFFSSDKPLDKLWERLIIVIVGSKQSVVSSNSIRSRSSSTSNSRSSDKLTIGKLVANY